MKKYQKELILIFIVLTPYIYLAFVWNSIPTEIDFYTMMGDCVGKVPKNYFLPPMNLIGIFFYLFMLLFPILDPKKRIQEMGNKYFIMRTVMAISFSSSVLYQYYAYKSGVAPDQKVLLLMAGVMSIAYGNYIQTLRPNYFYGFKNPWTLESELVWRKAHRLGGRLTIATGVIIIGIVYLFSLITSFIITGVLLSGTMIYIYAYSYFIFKKEKIKEITQL